MSLYFINLCVIFVIFFAIGIFFVYLEHGTPDIDGCSLVGVVALILAMIISLVTTVGFQGTVNTNYIRNIKYTTEQDTLNIKTLNDTISASSEVEGNTYFIYAEMDNQKKYTVYIDNKNGGITEKTYVGKEVDILTIKEDEKPYIVIEKKTAHKPEYFKHYKYLSNNYKNMDFSEYDEVTILEIHIPESKTN